MNRAVLGALRTTAHPPPRHANLFRTNTRAFVLPTLAKAPSNHSGLRRSRRPTDKHYNARKHCKQQQQYNYKRFQGRPPLESSMFLRRGTACIALLSTLIGFGAWIAYGPTHDLQAITYQFTSGGMDPTTTVANAALTRKVLVLGLDELHTGTFVGDGPISKTTSNDGRRIVEMLTPEQATNALRKGEQSYLVNRGEGVVRYDVVQLPSNDPIEDDHAEQIIQMQGADKELNDWMFWGVYDGHSGWTTSAKLRQTLITAVAQSLNDTYLEAGTKGPASDDIDAAIKNAFARVDDDIVHRSVEKVFKTNSKAVAAEALAPASSGSCALLSFYDSRTKELKVACTGDSRAVLGRQGPSGKWTATPLSTDQTGSNPDEEKRIRDQHPGEPYAVSKGRVLGLLEPTRVFGDAHFKWSVEVATKLRRHFFGRRTSPYLLTPPYVTAEPVVTTTTIRPDKGDFVVMATDGLWEMLTNEEVIGLVGKWLESDAGRSMGATKAPMPGGGPAWTKFLGFGKKASLPVEQAAPPRAEALDGQKTPVRRLQWGMASESDDHFIVKDNNVATHIIRNALGGKREEHLCALLTLPAPTSRRFRDDLTVQVIFFGRGDTTGEVKVNLDATAGTTEPSRPKL